MPRQKCSCMEVFGEDPNCAKHGAAAARKHRDYGPGYRDAFDGKESAPNRTWWYYEGYRAGHDFRKALEEAGFVQRPQRRLHVLF